MRKLTMAIVGLGFGMAAATASANEAREHGQSVTENDLPAPVKSTFDKEAHGGQVEELRKESLKDGRTVHWGELVKNGKETELKVSDSGKVLHRGKAHAESKEKGEQK
jgi:hypothetical protein